MATSTLTERLARFVARAPKCAKTFTVSVGGELVAEVPAGEAVVDEVACACEDAAAAVGRQVTATVRAVDADGQQRASLTLVVKPPTESSAVAPTAEMSRVIQLLAGHSQELTRLVISSQQAILSAYQSALRDSARRAAEAEARAAVAEEVAAEASSPPALPPALEALLTTAITAKSQGNS